MLLGDVNGNRTPGNVHARRHDIRYYIHIILPMLLATTNSDLLPRVPRSSLSRAFPQLLLRQPESSQLFRFSGLALISSRRRSAGSRCFHQRKKKEKKKKERGITESLVDRLFRTKVGEQWENSCNGPLGQGYLSDGA